MSKEETNKNVMTEEMAVEEFYSFLKTVKRRPDPKDKLIKLYPDVIDSMVSGNLVFKEGVPEYTLIEPFSSYTTLKFKTRVKPGTLSNLAKNVDLENDAAKYQLVIIAHVCGVATVAELDLMGKFDYDTIRQLSALFL